MMRLLQKGKKKMIKFEFTDTCGWMGAIRGMRNPLNSWGKSDTPYRFDGVPFIGENDLDLMKKLSRAGADHGKFLRMIHVQVDIVAPLYWWKEFDTYKVGTVANSCSTMHKIHAAELKPEDFSIEKINTPFGKKAFEDVMRSVEQTRKRYLETQSKEDWDELIQMLPSSYNQRRTVDINYQVLKNMHLARRNHKLSEWHDFCTWCESLPYFTEICIEM